MTTARRMIDSLNLIWVLTWMSFQPRGPRDGARLFWAFAEPAGQMLIMMLIFDLIGRTPGYGRSFALFLLTGVAMLNLFSAGSRLVMQGVLRARHPARLAQVGVFHEALARLAFQALVVIGYMAALTWAVGQYQQFDAWPWHVERCAEALFWGAVLAFGVGLIRAAAEVTWPVAQRVYAIASRALLFVSGIFYVPSFMPPQFRELLALNPVLHVVELMRLGMFDEYPTIVFSPLYLAFWALGATALGMALVWINRRRFLA